MDTTKYVEIENLLMEELHGNKYATRVLMSYIDNIVFNARMEKNDTFIKDIVIAIATAYWNGYTERGIIEYEF